MNQKIFQQVNAALYCRLSREDDSSLESSSITNQKAMLTEFANSKGWNIFNVYVDDGYSGGNFDRPAFKQLIDDIENGHINILVTKDLSRLGRNYIEQGYYLEDYFPSKNVRYIAINDNYDSINGDDDIAPFKSIFNQYYLRDISKKVKSANLTRIKKGNLPNGNHIPLYGYKNNENSERVPDPETAPVVRKIFELYNQGYLMADIIKYLKDNKIVTTGYYNFKTYNYNPSLWINAPEEKKYKWSHAMIDRIISNKEYLGHLILQKKKTVSYKTHKREHTKNDERYFFENKFPAIIDEDTFRKSEELRKVKTRSKIPLDLNPYNNLLFCSNCGKALSLTIRKKAKYTIGNNFVCRSTHCTHHATVMQKTIDSIIEKEIPLFINYCLSHEKKIKKIAKMYQEKNILIKTDEEKQIERLQDRNNKLNHLIQTLFERNAIGELPTETYKRMLDKYKKELEENSGLINSYENRSKKKKKYLFEVTKFMEFIHNIKDKPLDISIIKAIIHKIEIIREHKRLSFKIHYNSVMNLFEDVINGK